MSEKVTAACPACGEKHGIEVWNRINVGENPELKAKVKARCSCGNAPTVARPISFKVRRFTTIRTNGL